MRKLLLSVLLLTAGPAVAQNDGDRAPSESSLTLQPLDAELSRLDTHTALIVPFQGAKGSYGVWSPDASRLASYISGRWVSVNLGSLSLEGVEWGGDRFGALRSVESTAEAPEASEWSETFSERWIRTRGGTEIELRQERTKSVLVVTRPDPEKDTRWEADWQTNCHSLTLSPDERYVAFLCDSIGVFAHRLDQGGLSP